MVRADAFGKYRDGTIKRIVETQSTHPKALPDDPRAIVHENRYDGPTIDVETRSPAVYGQVLEGAD